MRFLKYIGLQPKIVAEELVKNVIAPTVINLDKRLTELTESQLLLVNDIAEIKALALQLAQRMHRYEITTSE